MKRCVKILHDIVKKLPNDNSLHNEFKKMSWKKICKGLSFYASWKHLKTSTFLMFSGGIDRNNFHDISYVIAKWFERLDPALSWKF